MKKNNMEYLAWVLIVVPFLYFLISGIYFVSGMSMYGTIKVHGWTMIVASLVWIYGDFLLYRSK